MFRSTLPSPLADTDVIEHQADLVPLSHLELDLPRPAEGWADFLGRRAIAFVPDDLGRDCVRRQDARRLLDEQRAEMLQAAKRRKVAEAAAVEADRVRRASLGQGVKVPDGLSYAEAVIQAELDSQTYRPRRRSLVEDLLSNDGITFHPIQHEAGESS